MSQHNIPVIKNFNEFIVYHNANKANDRQRLGQRFVNLYIKEPWPELFYMIDEWQATQIIISWLERHQYDMTSFPQKIGSGRA